MARLQGESALSRATPVVIGSFALALDQLSKGLVVSRLGPGRTDHRFEIVDPLLRFQYVENRGAAFGLFRGGSELLTLLAIGVIITVGVVYLRMPAPSRTLAIGVGLILGGALGNLLDRLRLGHVIDFIAVGPWPKFNVADSAITLGVILLAVTLTVVEPGPEENRSPGSRSMSTSGTPMKGECGGGDGR